MADPFHGMIHKHLHIKQASCHWMPQVPLNIYPKVDTLASESQGLNLSFPVPDLEQKRGYEVCGDFDQGNSHAVARRREYWAALRAGS